MNLRYPSDRRQGGHQSWPLIDNLNKNTPVMKLTIRVTIYKSNTQEICTHVTIIRPLVPDRISSKALIKSCLILWCYPVSNVVQKTVVQIVQISYHITFVNIALDLHVTLNRCFGDISTANNQAKRGNIRQSFPLQKDTIVCCIRLVHGSNTKWDDPGHSERDT